MDFYCNDTLFLRYTTLHYTNNHLCALPPTTLTTTTTPHATLILITSNISYSYFLESTSIVTTPSSPPFVLF